MNGASTPRTDQHPHVLFAILDWGMGHATRTWPLILAARRLGAEVTIASRGTAGPGSMPEWPNGTGAMTRRTPAPWSRVDKPGVTITYARGIATRCPHRPADAPLCRSIPRARWATAIASTRRDARVQRQLLRCVGRCPGCATCSSRTSSTCRCPALPGPGRAPWCGGTLSDSMRCGCRTRKTRPSRAPCPAVVGAHPVHRSAEPLPGR